MSGTGETVACACDFSFAGGSGTGKIAMISTKSAEVVETTEKPSNKVTLIFRIFETSTPIRLPSKVVSSQEKSFVAEFTDTQPVMRNMLRMAIVKLRSGGDAVRCARALLRDGRR